MDEFNVPVPAPAPALPLPPPPLPLPLPPPLPLPHSLPELVPVKLDPQIDPRRAKLRFKDPKFPAAGLMREEGGVFAFMEYMRSR